MTRRAVFLDLDGVVFASYPIWDRVVAELLATYNLPYTEELKATLWQLSMDQADAYLCQLIGQEAVTVAALKKRKMDLLEKAYCEVDLMPGLELVLSEFSKAGYQILAVTANYGRLACLGLASHGLLPYFSGIYSCLDEGYEDKTATFLTSICQREQVLPDCVIMVEDSPKNLQVAGELGIKGIFLENPIYTNPNQPQLLVIDELAQLLPYVIITKE